MTTIIKLLVISILVNFANFALSQNIEKTTIIDESFKNNDRGWEILRDNNLTLSITEDQYIIDYNPTTSGWNNSVNLPDDIRRCLSSDQVEISFDLNIFGRNEQPYTGIGFIFDLVGSSYNLLYIGEEAGKIFSFISQKRERFMPPIKDGKGVNYSIEQWCNIKIRKNTSTYQVLINDKTSLTFIHKEPIEFSKLYFTAGQYSIANFSVVRSDLIIDRKDFDLHSKAFDPSSHKIYILLAGITDYMDAAVLPHLNSPVNDITAMKQFWQSPEGGAVPNENIVWLPNKLAKSDNIIKATTYLSLKATGNDVVIIYLSGHGLPGYYCSFDGHLQYSKLASILNLSKAKNKLMIVDACFAGSIKNYISPPGKGGINPQDLNTLFYFEVSSAEANTNYLLSCDNNEISADGPPDGKSAFTTALLNVLTKSNGYSGNVITLGQAYEALKLYFNSWNQKHTGLMYKNGQNQTGKPIPVVMNPQLLYLNRNNNLPLVIIP